MAIEPNFIEYGVAAIGAITGGLLTAALGLKRTVTKMTQESVATARATSELEVIELLREELRRNAEQSRLMAEQNKELASEIHVLQRAVNDLNEEIGNLRAENRALKDEVTALHEEINKKRIVRVQEQQS